jgi:shikimate kinase/3-dehydroquinate synthase
MQRPLVIVGPRGSAAPNIARRVAAGRGAEVIELEAPAGVAGRASARERLLAEVAAGGSRVLVVPSVLLARRAVRLAVLDQAVVVAVDGGSALEPDADPDTREAEAAVYQERHARLDADAGDPAALGEIAARTWERDGVAVAVGEASYVVEVGRELIRSRLPELVGAAPAVCWVTDATVEALHGVRVAEPLAALGRTVTRHVLEPGERSKVMRSVVHIWNRAAEAGLDRGSVVVGFGGGVVTDTAGFAAATWMRGVRWIALPTTLLAMVDASVGGKTGVDLREAKNGVGAFWQPSGVVCDMETLRTESARGFASGLAEVVKTALIGDATLLDRLEAGVEALAARDADTLTEVVRRCVRVKARIVGLDVREGGLRAVLNLGHTVGHALETLGGYETLTHGEAVSLGLVAALRIGERRGVTPPALTARVTALLERLGLPTALEPWDLGAAARLIAHDKKRAGGKLRFVLTEEPGRVVIEPIPLSELEGLVTSLQ